MATPYVRDVVIDIVTVLRHRANEPQAYMALTEGNAFCAVGLYLDERWVKTGQYKWKKMNHAYSMLIPVDSDQDHPALFPFIRAAPTQEERGVVSRIVNDMVAMNDHGYKRFSMIADELVANLELGRYDIRPRMMIESLDNQSVSV